VKADVPLARALLILVVLTASGTTGYILVEGMHWWDAFYMTVITLSTVGFQEVQPLHPAGRLFTIALIIGGVSTAAYVAASVARLLAEDVFTNILLGTPMQKQIDRMSQHVIVCGFGRLGQIVAEELARTGVPIVVIERDAEKEGELKRSGYPYLLGSATSDELLEQAGLARARAVVAGTNSDPDNVFITLAAREKRPDIQIHARGEGTEAARRLRQAGADYILSAYQMGGMSLAASILRPSVARFLELARPRGGGEIDLEEIRVGAHSTLAGQSLRQVEGMQAKIRIVALMRKDQIELAPDAETPIASGDFLVVIGARKALEALAQLALG
jgi:voltage-gated potassium channel